MIAVLHPFHFSDATKRELVRKAGDAQDAMYDAIQAFADALYEEAVKVKGHSPDQADLVVRGLLVGIGEEMAHDWVYGPDAA
jgi:hypothetical protein